MGKFSTWHYFRKPRICWSN